MCDIPGPNEMGDREKSAQNDADTSDGYVCNAEEWILASHDRSGGYDDRFGTAEDVDWEV